MASMAFGIVVVAACSPSALRFVTLYFVFVVFARVLLGLFVSLFFATCLVNMLLCVACYWPLLFIVVVCCWLLLFIVVVCCFLLAVVVCCLLLLFCQFVVSCRWAVICFRCCCNMSANCCWLLLVVVVVVVVVVVTVFV